MPTVNYTATELYNGTASIDLTLGTAYTFTIANNSGASYFTMETPFNYRFDGSTPKNTSGSFTSTGSLTPIITDYVAGFALPQASSYAFIFRPAANVTGATLRLIGTGGITLALSY